MDIKSVAPTLTREQRGLRLYREHGDGIEEVADGFSLCPSESGPDFYHVDLGDESCDCHDFRRHGVACKHVFAVAISRAKRRARATRCDGCGDKILAAGLLEVGPEHAAHGLGAQEGERYCRPCAGHAGVL